MSFSTFSRALQMVRRLIFRPQRHGDPDEATLIATFLHAEKLLHEHGATDPRIPFLFAGLLVDLDDYDYAVDCLRNLEAMLVMPSADITFAISEVRRLQALRVDRSRQALARLNPSQVGWVYSTTSCAPLPNTLPPIQPSIFQFAPFSVGRLSERELERLLRSISIQTNVIEGVLRLSAGEVDTLVNHGFATVTFHHDRSPNVAEEIIHQILVDSQSAIQLVLNRVSSKNTKLDEAFVLELHKRFTRTACISSERHGEGIRSCFISRGKYKFISNHAWARNRAYHFFCQPEQVPAEMKKVLNMLEYYLTNVRNSPENGIWLAAWFHHRFVNIHPFRDGNGRVTRALVSAILLQFGLLPFLVAVEDKEDYFHALMAADADGSNLAPLAKFIVRQQFQALFLCKNEQVPVPLPQSSEFRRRRIEEAHRFIQQTAAVIVAPYNRRINVANRAPSLNVHLHDHRVLELARTDVVYLGNLNCIYLVYGSLFPLKTDTFAFYIVIPCPQNTDVASIRGLTGLSYGLTPNEWERRLGQFLVSDLGEVLKLVISGS